MNNILRSKKKLIPLLIAMVSLDWLIKKWVVTYDIPYHLNTGIAFGVLDSSGMGLVLAIVGLIIVFVLFKYEKNYFFPFLFIIAGALGNIIDRFVYLGVVDYINIGFIGIPWFNLADVFINIGIMLYIYSVYISNHNCDKK